MALSMNLFNPQPDSALANKGADVLIKRLHDRNGQVRQQARWALVHHGSASVPALVDALGEPDRNVRWEAAKALGEIADPSGAKALVAALDDERFGVRWLAAEGLIRMGDAALPPLMARLAQSANSVWLRGGAHHVLRGLNERAGVQHHALPREVLAVVAALEDLEPAMEVPPLACDAYRALTGQEHLPES
jgi:HEAT repeat protein